MHASWTYRLDILATGIKNPVGIKVNGNNIVDIERVAQQIEHVVKQVPGVTSALAGGRWPFRSPGPGSLNILSGQRQSSN